MTIPTDILTHINQMPEPTPEVLDYATHVLSEWLNDHAPIGEQRYREPARMVLRFAQWAALQ